MKNKKDNVKFLEKENIQILVKLKEKMYVEMRDNEMIQRFIDEKEKVRLFGKGKTNVIKHVGRK